MRYVLIVLLLFPIACFAQVKITGKIVSLADKKPVANASVFLSNATVGNKTNDDGAFTLSNVRTGQYELVVTVIGYETYRQNVMAAGENITLPNIGLMPKTTELKEVNVRPDPDWERNFDIFKREFLGLSEMAKQCKILNPEMVDLSYDRATRSLTGSSYDFLEIENKALGYRVKYLLSEFVKDNKADKLYYAGSALFEDLKGSARQQKRWLKNRKEAYEGSSMHFLRSVTGNSITAEGFKVLRLIRKPNPAYNGFNDRYIGNTLVSTPLKVEDFARLTDQKGVFALSFSNCLYVMYTKKKNNQSEGRLYHPLEIPNYLITIVSFDAAYSLYDSNGIILDPNSLYFEGEWAKNRIAEMLPVDYVPEHIK